MAQQSVMRITMADTAYWPSGGSSAYIPVRADLNVYSAVGGNSSVLYTPDNSVLSQVQNSLFISARMVCPFAYWNNSPGALTVYLLANRIPVGYTQSIQSYLSGSTTNIGNATISVADLTVSFDISGKTQLEQIISRGMVQYAVPASGEARVFSHTYSDASLRPYIEYTYQDAGTPSTVTALAPVNTVINGEANNQFAWSYEQPVGIEQAQFDLQYFVNGAWTDIYSAMAWTEHFYVVPGGTLLSGGTVWRVRAYHNSGSALVASDWAQASVTVTGKPSPPSITNYTQTPRPEIDWTSTDQAGYRVTVTVPGIEKPVYDSGTVFGLSRTWKYPRFLSDGSYVVSLQVVNSEGAWSAVVPVDITVENVPGDAIGLSVSSTLDWGAALLWDTTGTYNGYIVYRNGLAVERTMDTQYTDYYSIGTVEYVVRGVNGDNYTDSGAVSATVTVKYAVLSALEPINWLELKVRRNSPPIQASAYSGEYEYVQFERPANALGLVLPQVYRSLATSRTHTFTFTFRNREDYLQLQQLLNTTVIYKDSMGERIIGNLDSITPTADHVYDFEFTITETDSMESADA